VNAQIAGAIDAGLLLLVGIAPGDTREELTWMARKIVGLRIFSDQEGRMNRSLLEVGGSILAVSQFTLFGDVRKGRRPSFTGAGAPEMAEPAFHDFCTCLRNEGARVETGVFGTHMDVRLLNDGPVTLLLERPEPRTL
jgi:D-tyrosyl-tRNA(Tyr) deacylase